MNRPDFQEAPPQHFTKIADLKREHLDWVLAQAQQLRVPVRSKLATNLPRILDGRSIAFLSTKESLRTGGSIEQAAALLGGGSKFIGKDSLLDELGKPREPFDHMAHCLDEMGYPVVFARVHKHAQILKLIEGSELSHVVNALCDEHHPLQALADAEALRINTDSKRPKVVFTGDGNNVAKSLGDVSAMLGWDFVHTGPEERKIKPANWQEMERLAAEHGGTVRYIRRPEEAVEGASMVYADVFASMGEKGNKEQLEMMMSPYKVTAKLMEQAGPNAKFGHCLPVDPNYSEVEPEVVNDRTRSLVWTIAGCRTDTTTAVLRLLLRK